MPETVKETWAILELMGHVKLAGRISEEEKFGSKLGRIDIPTAEKCTCPNASRTSAEYPTVECDRCHGAGLLQTFITQHFGGGSVYRITYVTEEVARHVARSVVTAPVHAWDFPKPALPAPVPTNLGDPVDAEFEVHDDFDDEEEDEP